MKDGYLIRLDDRPIEFFMGSSDNAVIRMGLLESDHFNTGRIEGLPFNNPSEWFYGDEGNLSKEEARAKYQEGHNWNLKSLSLTDYRILPHSEYFAGGFWNYLKRFRNWLLAAPGFTSKKGYALCSKK